MAVDIFAVEVSVVCAINQIHYFIDIGAKKQQKKNGRMLKVQLTKTEEKAVS